MTDLEKAARTVLGAISQFIGKELTVGQRYTNEGQQLLDAEFTLRQAISNSAEQPLCDHSSTKIRKIRNYPPGSHISQHVSVNPKSIKPVAWVREHELPLAPGEAFSWVETFFHKTPLYTSPQSKPWVGLTGDEIFECWVTGDVVAAVEAKLKEKNIK